MQYCKSRFLPDLVHGVNISKTTISRNSRVMQPGSEALVNLILTIFRRVLMLQSSYSVSFGDSTDCYERGRRFSLVCLWLWKPRETGRILFGEFRFTHHKFPYRGDLSRSVLLEDTSSEPLEDIPFYHRVREWCPGEKWSWGLNYDKRHHVVKSSGDLVLVLWYVIVHKLSHEKIESMCNHQNQKLGTIKNWEDRYNVFMVVSILFFQHNLFLE